ncbi:2OG-Fe(II) oxygenase [Actibacterium sp. MT2.3-13A]|uniref:2OG-Fe(II) oxygenase n=1 Tax=Actibacterium sp. MT2.3-13A TaxID=2828332 RepID=UPI001BAC9310|nr:2OG-Fe(II) oxygenase [Actibacterium sp. MT2.3-13A]
MQTVHTIPDAFTAAECERIAALAETGRLADAGLVGGVANHSLRRADIAWLDEIEGAEWVTDRIFELVREANRAVFDFELRDFSESAQVARYGAERSGHFGWHSDIGDGPLARRRKLTLVVQLSDPAAYEGGVLELMPDSNIRAANAAQGSATLFPSFVLHRVTPVTRGTRHSLTIWAHGPAFR